MIKRLSEMPYDRPEELSKLLRLVRQVGVSVSIFAEYVGGIGLLMAATVKSPFKSKLEWKHITQQFHRIGVQSLALTNLIAVFTGMVLALQFIVGLRRFGLELYSGQVVGVALCRELGPVLTSLMVAARVGSGITAELGSMTVSEQILAIRAMGGSPIAKLVFPRVLVTTLAAPLLTVVADFVGIMGGMFATAMETGIGANFYLEQVKRTVEIEDFTGGVAKTFFFGFFIGAIACHQGLNVKGGTRGVGEATTKTVVHCAIVIFISDYFLTKLFLLL